MEGTRSGNKEANPVHARTDYAHAEAVRRILRAHGVEPNEPRGGGLPRRSRPLWGRGPAVTGMEESLRIPRPQIGGC
jgi:hypothetical protein